MIPRGAVALALLVFVMALGVGRWFWSRSAEPAPAPVEEVDPGPSRQPSTSSAETTFRVAPPRKTALEEATVPAPEDVSEFAQAWDALDLQMVRRVMPENLVWAYAMPSADTEVLAQRQVLKEKWESLFGKVYSNTATIEEVNAYYSHQQQLSSDYVEFTSYIIDRHADDLREQDLRLLHLARDLHTSRLQEIPRRQAEALARREAFAKERREWTAEKGDDSTPGLDSHTPTEGGLD